MCICILSRTAWDGQCGHPMAKQGCIFFIFTATVFMEFRKQFQGFLLRIWAPRLEREGGNLLNISWMNERISFYPCCPLILSECAAPIPNRSLLFPECPCLPYFLCAPPAHLWPSSLFAHTPHSHSLPIQPECLIIHQASFFPVLTEI